MARYALKSTILCFSAFFWLLATLLPAYGSGSRDPDLAKADILIKEKQYDEAIRVLTDFSRRNPNRFEHAEKRLRIIYNHREEFNRTADELINTFFYDPDNSEKILALSTRIYEMEDESSPLLLSFAARAREIAAFNVARTRLQVILTQARSLLDIGESEEALKTYAGGIHFLRDEFFAAGYGDDTESIVLQETERMNYVLNSFPSESRELRILLAELTGIINSGKPEEAPELIDNLIPVIDRFTELKNELYTAVNTFDVILEELKILDPEMGDRNHLSFLSRLIHGRQNEVIQEGMLGAFENLWKNTVSSVITAITNNAESIVTTGLAAFTAGDFIKTTETFDSLVQYTDLSPVFFDKHCTLNQREEQIISLFDNYLLLNDIPAYIKLKSLDEAGIITKRAAALAGQSDILSVIDRSSLTKWQEGTINTATALNIEQQTKNSITGISRAMEEVIKDARVTDSITSNFYDTGYIKNTLNIIENYYSDILAEERESAYRYYTIANNDLGNSLSARREELERGRTLLNGLSRQREDGASVIEYFPTEAFNTLTTMLSVISGDLERGSSLLADYSRETASIITVDPVLSMFNTSRETINELNNIRTQGTAIVNTARSRMALAETYRQEGERLFREAQTAFQRQNFDTARERIQRASERYNNSLEIQESAALRQQWDNQLLELGQAIVNAENEMIIAEVRNLVNNARVTYFAGNFQQAENNLIRARNRWRLTNPEENDEVLYWLGIVRGAMSARSGRIIPPTAPLYPEMSQLLNEARRSYEEGTRLINAGSRSQGLTKFDEARQLTREVRLIFPVNQEAGILELRIEQFTDPAGFNATFEQRLRTAINGTRQRSMEAFADLQNLAEINPRYPRIAAILTQAEIDMGYRPPPPNPQDLTRSRELTASASRILEENITTLYEVALTQINEAITLNPENTDAARIKDRLLNRMSVPGAIVLTSQDEEEYQRAVRELQSGNNLVALAVVERLMQNPRNRNITKLIELQRRIQSVL